jgi:hypothetical protein
MHASRRYETGQRVTNMVLQLREVAVWLVPEGASTSNRYRLPKGFEVTSRFVFLSIPTSARHQRSSMTEDEGQLALSGSNRGKSALGLFYDLDHVICYSTFSSTECGTSLFPEEKVSRYHSLSLVL